MTKPKIFVWAEQYNITSRDYVVCATAEDGKLLAEHVSSTKLWARKDMGLIGKNKHEVYDEHYPEGWELVDLVDLTPRELDNHVELMAAIDRGSYNG